MSEERIELLTCKSGGVGRGSFDGHWSVKSFAKASLWLPGELLSLLKRDRRQNEQKEKGGD